jgi:hypothetical protein
MYICRQTPWWLEFLSPWGKALGVAPTVGSTARWGYIPTAVGHGSRNPSVVVHGVRSPIAVPHGGRVLALWGCGGSDTPI